MAEEITERMPTEKDRDKLDEKCLICGKTVWEVLVEHTQFHKIVEGKEVKG